MAKTVTTKPETANMLLWETVEKTNPADTKHVSHRGGFTSIDAYTQIKNATREFGPVGLGWGWKIESVVNLNGTVGIQLEMWVVNHDRTFSVMGQAKTGTVEKPDDDALKKALTDGITKGLSYLGFNADVFLGKFDNNKYVEQRKNEEAGVASASAVEADQIWLDGFKETMKMAESHEILKDCIKTNSGDFKAIANRNPEMGKKIRAAVATERKRLPEETESNSSDL